jgi:hypothetical protein
VLRLPDRFAEWVIAIPLSLAVVAGTSIILFYGGVWSADREFGLLLGLCLAGLAWSHFASREGGKLTWPHFASGEGVKRTWPHFASGVGGKLTWPHFASREGVKRTWSHFASRKGAKGGR